MAAYFQKWLHTYLKIEQNSNVFLILDNPFPAIRTHQRVLSANFIDIF